MNIQKENFPHLPNPRNAWTQAKFGNLFGTFHSDLNIRMYKVKSHKYWTQRKILTKSVITIFSCNVCKICASPSLDMSLLDMSSRCTVVLLCNNQSESLIGINTVNSKYIVVPLWNLTFHVFVNEKGFRHFLLLMLRPMRIWIWAGSFIFCFHSIVQTFFFIFKNILLFCKILRQWF